MNSSGAELPPAADARAAGRGDGAAARRVLAALHPALVRYFCARLGPGAATDATAAEALRRVGAALDRTGAGLPALAYRLARELADEHADVAVAVGAPRGGPRGALLPEPLGELPTELREVLVLRVAVGLSLIEVAALLDIPAEAVLVRQHRALARLRAAT